MLFSCEGRISPQNDEERHEYIEGDQEAEKGEDNGGKDPGGGVADNGVGMIYAKEGIDRLRHDSRRCTE